MSGVAPVTAPIAEAFVPQMLNHESVGGVNFKKGCYPGQEVVARSQFRGTLKRRAYRVACAEALAVGQDVFHDSDAEQPCGLVAAAAPNPTGGWSAIVSMQTQAASAGQLHAGTASGPVVAAVAPALRLARRHLTPEWRRPRSMCLIAFAIAADPCVSLVHCRQPR